MVATKTVHNLLATAERRLVDFDPNASAITIVDLDPTGANEALPIEHYENFLCGIMVSVGTGGIAAFQIAAGTDADLTGATAVVSHALGSTPNAVGDYVWLECDVEQIREVLDTATHVGVRVTLNTPTDECVVYFERSKPRWQYGGLTADYVS